MLLKIFVHLWRERQKAGSAEAEEEDDDELGGWEDMSEIGGDKGD